MTSCLPQCVCQFTSCRQVALSAWVKEQRRVRFKQKETDRHTVERLMYGMLMDVYCLYLLYDLLLWWEINGKYGGSNSTLAK